MMFESWSQKSKISTWMVHLLAQAWGCWCRTVGWQKGNRQISHHSIQKMINCKAMEQFIHQRSYSLSTTLWIILGSAWLRLPYCAVLSTQKHIKNVQSEQLTKKNETMHKPVKNQEVKILTHRLILGGIHSTIAFSLRNSSDMFFWGNGRTCSGIQK